MKAPPVGEAEGPGHQGPMGCQAGAAMKAPPVGEAEAPRHVLHRHPPPIAAMKAPPVGEAEEHNAATPGVLARLRRNEGPAGRRGGGSDQLHVPGFRRCRNEGPAGRRGGGDGA